MRFVFSNRNIWGDLNWFTVLHAKCIFRSVVKRGADYDIELNEWSYTYTFIIPWRRQYATAVTHYNLGPYTTWSRQRQTLFHKLKTPYNMQVLWIRFWMRKLCVSNYWVCSTKPPSVKFDVRITKNGLSLMLNRTNKLIRFIQTKVWFIHSNIY